VFAVDGRAVFVGVAYIFKARLNKFAFLFKLPSMDDMPFIAFKAYEMMFRMFSPLDARSKQGWKKKDYSVSLLLHWKPVTALPANITYATGTLRSQQRQHNF